MINTHTQVESDPKINDQHTHTQVESDPKINDQHTHTQVESDPKVNDRRTQTGQIIRPTINRQVKSNIYSRVFILYRILCGIGSQWKHFNPKVKRGEVCLWAKQRARSLTDLDLLRLFLRQEAGHDVDVVLGEGEGQVKLLRQLQQPGVELFVVAAPDLADELVQEPALVILDRATITLVMLVIADRFYTALFSALERTHYVLVVGDSK